MGTRASQPRSIRDAACGVVRGALVRLGLLLPTRDLGVAGERLAARRLRKKGYRVLARNVRATGGELDLVTLAPDRNTLVFVEVKTRRIVDRRPSPPPEASITAKKRATLIALARRVSRAQGWDGRPVRIDVVAIDWPEHGEPDVRHYENAVTPGAARSFHR